MTQKGNIPIIGAVREFILTCPFLDKFEEAFPMIDVEELGEETNNYMIETVPVEPVVRKYLDGSSIRRFSFVFASRELNADTETKIENSGFYEDFTDWLEKCSNNKVFPTLKDGKEVMEIKATTCGYVFNDDETKSQYQIQCTMKYYQRVKEN